MLENADADEARHPCVYYADVRSIMTATLPGPWPPAEDLTFKPFDKVATLKTWMTCNTIRLVSAAVGFAAVSAANFLDPRKQSSRNREDALRGMTDAVTVADLHEASIA